MKRNYRNPAADAFYRAILADPAGLPFRFSYDGQEFSGIPADFAPVEAKCLPAEDKETRILTFARENLSLTLHLTHYFSHGVTEFRVDFENVGTAPTGIIENPRAELDFAGRLPQLKGILGDHVNQYAPYCIDLADNRMEFSSETGQATHIDFPYFNLEHGEGGTMLAIGWAGTWRAEFASDGENTRVILSSVNGLATRLLPGERIRTALFVIAPYRVRSEHYAVNFWRDWFVRHNLPKADAAGNDLAPFSTCCLSGDTGLPNSDGSISERYFTWKPSLEKMISEDIKVDFRWVDAGWYVRPDGKSEETDWWGTVGTWTLDPEKWPGETFRESTDFARANGMKTLLWFEPERLTDPEGMIRNFGYDPSWYIRIGGQKTIINNIGIPECLEYTTRRICDTLTEGGVEMYREDNNYQPTRLWVYLDGLEGEDRRGITECKFIAAHYKMWDDIIACTSANGGCAFVDSCASGGGRNDIESLRRGVPLLRSDSDRTTVALRLSMTTAFNKWIPFCGSCSREQTEQLSAVGVSDPYVWRASYLPALNVYSQFVQDPDQDFSGLREGLREWKILAKYLLKEFYVLTPWHRECDRTDYTAFSFFDPEEEAGVLLTFRQEKCERDTLRIRLPFADADNAYILRDADTGEETECRGPADIQMQSPRSARLFYIRRA
ncbi:MAG: alpha-galactosidase [Clostridia bacterium]|nr:alpha-galactosidase [Clostridia bacterium]